MTVKSLPPGPARGRKVFDPEKHCGVPRRSTDEHGPGKKGEPCRNTKGQNTDHLGTGRCWLHAGRSDSGKAAAAAERAAKALEGLGIPVPTDPQRALLLMVARSAGRIEAIIHQYDTERAKGTPDFAMLGALAREYGEERDRMARTAKVTIDADIAERQTKINEDVARAMVRALNAGLDAAGVSVAKRKAAIQAAVDELHRLDAEAPSGAVLN